MPTLLWLLLMPYLITPISTEIFTTGVGLFTNTSEHEHNSGCYMLGKMVGMAWWGAGYHNCISNPPIAFGLDWKIIPIHISLNSKAFRNYPEHRHDVEQYAFINKKLNAPGKPCMTVTGSNWWIEKDFHNLTFDIRMFYNSPIKIMYPSVCRELNTLSYHTSTIRSLVHCFSKPIEKSALQRTHQIQLTISISTDNMLLSESLLESIQLITGRINLLSDHSVFVARVFKIGFGRAVDIRLQFMSEVYSRNSCALLMNSSYDAYILSGILTCKNDVISHTGPSWNVHAVRLRVKGRLNGIPLYLMSNTEIALRVEALFNFAKLGCITYEPGHTASLLRPTEQRLVTFISGPSYADICNQVKQMMGANFYTFYLTCVKMTDLAQQKRNQLSSYRLKAKEPFYEIDELLYLERHAQLVFDLNKHYLSCEYNGYIQLDQ